MKTVLFTQRVEIVKEYGERRDCADQRIAAFLWRCGCLPVPVPNDPETAGKLAEQLRPGGILLTGGNSLVKYGGNAPERDAVDRLLIEMAVSQKIPVYGFCRGMQSILDFFGNPLQKVERHVAVRHIVYGPEGPMEVNSYHNEACLELAGDALLTAARTEDGVIEKIRHKSLPIVGTMWHPEREAPFRETDIQEVRSLYGVSL